MTITPEDIAKRFKSHPDMRVTVNPKQPYIRVTSIRKNGIHTMRVFASPLDWRAIRNEIDRTMKHGSMLVIQGSGQSKGDSV